MSDEVIKATLMASAILTGCRQALRSDATSGKSLASVTVPEAIPLLESASRDAIFRNVHDTNGDLIEKMTLLSSWFMCGE